MRARSIVAMTLALMLAGCASKPKPSTSPDPVETSPEMAAPVGGSADDGSDGDTSGSKGKSRSAPGGPEQSDGADPCGGDE